MLRFNHVGLIFVRMILLFQYILCCGSTVLVLFGWQRQENFNTSYVAVQLLASKNKSGLLILFQYILCCGSTFDLERGEKGSTHFNTSYVAVQLNKMVVII